MTLTPDLLAQLDAAERAATLGPWDTHSGMVRAAHGGEHAGDLQLAITTSHTAVAECIIRDGPTILNHQWSANADFIALLRTHARALIDAARERDAIVKSCHDLQAENAQIRQGFILSADATLWSERARDKMLKERDALAAEVARLTVEATTATLERDTLRQHNALLTSANLSSDRIISGLREEIQRLLRRCDAGDAEVARLTTELTP